MDISLVIPAYNERENLPLLVDACNDALAVHQGDHEIVLIDDGSTDGTGELLDSLAAQNAHITPVHHRPGQNIGCHPSELEGLSKARGDVMVFLPADLQIHPRVTADFVAAAQAADIVASHRVHRADPLWRRWLSAANNRVERALMGVAVHDAHSSMALSRRAVDEIVPLVHASSALIPAEILVRAAQRGMPITEIEIDHHPRAAGIQTGARLSEIVRVYADLVRLRRQLSA